MNARRPTRSAATTATILVTAALAMGLTGCSGRSSGAPLPAGAPVVDVSMRDYRFDYNSAIPAGQVVFRFHNNGKEPHDVTLQPLPEDFPPIDVQLHGTERRAVAPFASMPPIPPGDTDSFAVDLLPGQRYALICFTRTRDGQSHALMGMNSEFRTAGTPLPTPATTASPATEPEPDASEPEPPAPPPEG